MELSTRFLYHDAYAQVRDALGRPAPRRAASGEQLQLQVLDVVVSDMLAHAKPVPLDLVSRVLAEPDGTSRGSVVVTLFGNTAEGHSVAVHLTGFRLACHVAGTPRALDAFKSKLLADRDFKSVRFFGVVEEHHPRFYGFEYDPATRQRRQVPYLRVETATQSKYRQLRDMAHKARVRLVEYDDIPLYTKFMDASGITPFMWVSVTAGAPFCSATSCDIEACADMASLRLLPEVDRPAPFLFASCDIETYSSTGGFPSYKLAQDVVFDIGIAFQRLPAAGAARVLVSLVLMPELPIEELGKVTRQAARDGELLVIKYNDERALLQGWRDLVAVYADADMVMWYNGFRFDLPYMAHRVLKPEEVAVQDDHQCSGASRFFQFSKFVRARTVLKDKNLESSGMGSNEMFTYQCEYGRVTIDLMQLVILREGLKDNSLNGVCKKFLCLSGGTVSWQPGQTSVVGTGTCFTKLKPGDSVQVGEEFYPIATIDSDELLHLQDVPKEVDTPQSQRFVGQVTKIDMPHTELFKAYERRDFPQVLDYCARDCVAPLLVLARRKYWINDMEMCKITLTPAQQLYSRGQGIRGVNQVIRFAHQKGFLLDVPSRDKAASAKYKGATVVEPVKGFHTDPVLTLDFMSLYPSIIISRWMCWSTIVLEGECHPDVDYLTVKLADGQLVHFAQRVRPQSAVTQAEGAQAEGAQAEERIVCVLPLLEQNLLRERKVVKRAMGAAYDGADIELGDILNSKQLAIKVSANSMYGLTGAGVSMLCCKKIAEAVTSYGRATLEETKKLAVDWFGAQGVTAAIIYGDTDSVMVKMQMARPEGATDLEHATAAWEVGLRGAAAITASLNNGIILECEKVYLPYLLVMKKTYAGIKYEGPPPFKPCRQVRGLEMVKRDTSEFIRKAQGRIVDTVLSTGSEDAALPLVAELVHAVATDQVPLAQLASSKKLKRTYAGSLPVHARVNQLRAQRAPGSEAKAGERVSYIAIEKRGDGPCLVGGKKADMMDDPAYVEQQGWPINKEYYLTEFWSKAARVLPGRQMHVAKMVARGMEHNSRKRNIMATLRGKRTLMESLLEAAQCNKAPSVAERSIMRDTSRNYREAAQRRPPPKPQNSHFDTLPW